MQHPFDPFVRAYENDELMPFRRHIEAHGFFKALGSIEGQAVLDVGCGAGLYTRKYRGLGASRVVGLDVSSAMVDYAAHREADERQGIEYVVDDTVNAADHGTFDVVTAIYVLPYADTYERLVAMCRGIADALRPGGRLIAMPIAPNISYAREDYYKKYGFTLFPVDGVAREPMPDGTPLRLLSHVPELPIDVVAYHWSREANERALREAGFGSVAWITPKVTAAGVEQHGAEFWADYALRPHSAPLVAVKGFSNLRA